MPLSNCRGLGRSVSYVGRNQISLSVMLRAALVHKLPYELFFGPLHATVVQRLPLNVFLELAHGIVRKSCLSKLPRSFYMELSCKRYFTSCCMELLFKTCSGKLFSKLLRGSVVQQLAFDAIF